MKLYLLKRVFSIFFILLISTQWILGLVTIKLVEEVWVDQKISEHRTQISKEVATGLGVSDHIKFEQVNPSQYLRLGYGAPFMVSHDVKGEQLHFKVAQEKSSSEYQVKRIKLSDFNKESSKKIGYIISHIFLTYFESHESYEFFSISFPNHLNQMFHEKFYSNFSFDIPTPPPQIFL
ncbi:hypothetical protein MATR_25550 [Marivirga tractuosa]|uniref:Uncharacterized protein n=1 Tax=Marivirga tractuosa (strain ATCC 23168 / DSM 4126 / NBRC 15989 / NCIMB 1408 / VKM B-1430 / H-43) TaxID=643867 RepID=E4TPQ3_MARTH|nr:hypothetical protein [Marivirga tractuosa]ADR23590.1 hypothetical protein Ftrac_3620 [Marivirga tractuosa DSM 4126]BDD15730.1 hypothetical protein MATR_25550 [Marivirga tractuosa]